MLSSLLFFFKTVNAVQILVLEQSLEVFLLGLSPELYFSTEAFKGVVQASWSSLASKAARALKWLFCKSCGLLLKQLMNADMRACLEHFLCKAFPSEKV